MSSNILKAILNIVNHPVFEIKKIYYSKNNNRINSVGDALEEYIKDLFAETFEEKDPQERLKKLSSTFSYLGNSSNPPDLILKESDAIEVKKIESINNGIALNSSYPKAKLLAHSTLLNKACRECECVKWESKDMLYIIGVVKKDILEDICMVYGLDYAAEHNVYENFISRLKSGIKNTEGLDFSETKELARLNKVDPLGITNLRVRGMWHIENPFKVFSYIYKKNVNKKFNMMAIINLEKYKSLPDIDRTEVESSLIKKKGLIIKDLDIKSPNNPAHLVPAKLFHFSI